MKNLLVLASLAILLSCTKDDREEDTYLYFSLNESKFNGSEVFGYPYLMEGDTIGFVKTQSDLSNIGGKDQFEFSLTDEYPIGAFSVDQNTGCVSVKDGLLLDLKDQEFVKFSILVQNKGFAKTLSRGFIVTPLSADLVLNFYGDYEKDLRGLKIEDGQVLDTLLTSPRFGNVQYSLKQVIPSGAFEIDSESGIIKAVDNRLFNPLLYDKISAIVDQKVVHKESNRTWEKQARVNFFLTNFNAGLCGSSSKSYLYEIDYSVYPEKVIPFTNINKSDFTVREDIQITEEEYTFIPTKDLQLCNAMMFLGTNRTTRYSNLTLVSDQNVVLAQATPDIMDDGWGYYLAESMAPLNYVLRANEKYTLRRKITNVDKSTSYLSNTNGSDLSFPLKYEDITIIGAKFFDGTNELDVSGIPMINLSFVK